MPGNDKTTVANILVIEDNAGDILILEEVLEELGYSIQMQVIHDGEEALRYLHREGSFAEAAKPDIILLDMNLPRVNGFDLLENIKTDDDLKRIPIIILSTSKADTDINRSYDLHANCFVTKSGDLEEYMDNIKNIMSFWLSTVQLPRENIPLTR